MKASLASVPAEQLVLSLIERGHCWVPMQMSARVTFGSTALSVVIEFGRASSCAAAGATVKWRRLSKTLAYRSCRFG